MSLRTYVTRRMTFSASHRLHNPALTPEENLRLFGQCNHANGHGHNFDVEVTVAGDIDPHTGMVFNLSELKAVMTEVIEKDFDHKHLNLDVPAFKDLPPTAENIAVVLWRRLEPRLPKGLLYEVRLRETENNVVTFRG